MSSPLDEFLGSRSSLTRTQIERLGLQISLQKPQEDGVEGESRAKVSGVSQGSYYRVLGQARSNIDQALYTVLLCSRMGLIDMTDLRRLLDLISKAPSKVSEDDSRQVMSLVDALVKKIVMF